ncbi:MAG: transposase-like zinc-binding domain-containing protein [Anaerolineae bacterium]
MARRRSPDNPSCPHCGATHVIRNGHKDGRQRWVCVGSVGAPLGPRSAPRCTACGRRRERWPVHCWW